MPRPASSSPTAPAPQSYFRAAPNPHAKYAWVCPGPSLLDDGNSAACPESSTGSYRCCIDSSNGGAVVDEMCCPEKEKLARSHHRGTLSREP